VHDIQVIVRKMARALDRGGLAAAYGHCSMRLDEAAFLVCASKPMGLIAVGEDGTCVKIRGPLPDGVLGEVRMHQAVYAARPDVQAICRFVSPQLTALAALGRTPQARHGFGAYFYPQAPMHANPALVRDDAAAAQVAELLGSGAGVVISINGALTAAQTPAQALALAWYLEDSARVELAALASGLAESGPRLTEQQALARATWQGRVAERMWDYLCHGDPE